MMLKRSIYYKIDVHKNIIVATIVITNINGITEYIQKSFSTINLDIQKFHNWLIKNHCYHIYIEFSEKYWTPIFNYLEGNIDVYPTQPKYVKAIKGKNANKKEFQMDYRISTNLTLSAVLSFHQKIFGNCMKLQYIILNWPA